MVVFWDTALDVVLFVHDAHAPNNLPGNAIAASTPEKEICRRRDHKRRVRGTAGQAAAGCKCEVGVSPWIQPATVQKKSRNHNVYRQDFVGRGSAQHGGRSVRQQPHHVVDNHQVLGGRNDANYDRRVFCRNHRRAMNVVTRRVEPDAQRAQSCTDLRP